MTLIGALALLALGVLIGAPVRRSLARVFAGNWRPGAGTLGLAAMAAGLFTAVRGDWPVGLGLVLVGALLVLGARRNGGLGFNVRFRGRSFGGAGPAPSPKQAAMSRQDAADILGVAVDSDAATVRAAYLKQIRRAHPDAGGTPGLAAQLNRARDVLGGG
jgi:hypothetical protein